MGFIKFYMNHFLAPLTFWYLWAIPLLVILLCFYFSDKRYGR